DPITVLEMALSAGITAFQYREKGKGSLTATSKQALGQKLREHCLRYRIPFIVNDDNELAESLKADGIHVGQDDAPVEHVRKKFPDKIIGLSVSDQEELDKSPIQLVDYIGVGPMFPTTSKSDAKETVNTEWLET